MVLFQLQRRSIELLIKGGLSRRGQRLVDDLVKLGEVLLEKAFHDLHQFF